MNAIQRKLPKLLSKTETQYPPEARSGPHSRFNPTAKTKSETRKLAAANTGYSLADTSASYQQHSAKKMNSAAVPISFQLVSLKSPVSTENTEIAAAAMRATTTLRRTTGLTRSNGKSLAVAIRSVTFTPVPHGHNLQDHLTGTSP